MAIDPIILWAQNIQAKEAAKKWLVKTLRGRDGFETFRVLDIFKIKENREVFLVEINGEKRVIKRFIDAERAAIVLRLKTELDHLCQSMGDGPNQVNKCLMTLPEEGLAVMSFVPGEQLGKVINRVDRAMRSAILKQSGEWLNVYTSSRRRGSTFGAGFWIKKAQARPRDHLSSDDQELLLALIASMRQQAKTLGNAPVVQAATHGDFVPLNLHYEDGVIYGVDIQGESWMAIVREASRFLVWARMTREPEPEEAILYGVSEADFDAFISSNVLDEEEVHTILPFLIGEQLIARFAENYEQSEHTDRLRSAMISYLEGF